MGFMKPAIEVSDAFEKVNIGTSRSRKYEAEGLKAKMDSPGGSHVCASPSKAGTKNDHKACIRARKPPLVQCPVLICNGKKKFHCVYACTYHTEDEKRQYGE